jgi:hypothetical protein
MSSSSDSNVRNAPDYLDEIAAPPDDASVGMVTSVIAGTRELVRRTSRTRACRVRSARRRGVTMLCRAACASAVDGARARTRARGRFAEVAGVLAEDDVPGQRIRASAFRTELGLRGREPERRRVSRARSIAIRGGRR